MQQNLCEALMKARRKGGVGWQKGDFGNNRRYNPTLYSTTTLPEALKLTNRRAAATTLTPPQNGDPALCGTLKRVSQLQVACSGVLLISRPDSQPSHLATATTMTTESPAPAQLGARPRVWFRLWL